ncbi:MAG TPA: DUF1559 domain-containing protein [bacterium]|uniref:DUF1559 domain-containing protein n=1 Tax=candidate division TA06 bacterium ADurb.Bin417 TaxID=1852828 RepID=A0A1V5MKN7_UNCT6|nr:MAG: hypothetical protein BWY73_00108 [candidate division TA06 bacterium ADurb.Bin417]HNS49316.1 DUF1559 domain-containing protein [bacterium]
MISDLEYKKKESQLRCAITPVESLALVVIIICLLFLMLPVLLRAQRNARQVACLNNLRHLGAAFQKYLADWDGRPPCGDWDAAGHRRGAWAVQLAPYLDIQLNGDPAASAERINSCGHFFCPTSTASHRHYGLNHPGWRDLAGRNLFRSRRKLDSLVYLGEVAGPPWSIGGRTTENQVDYNRHHGRASFLFADGHVATGTPEEFGFHYKSVGPERVYWTGLE